MRITKVVLIISFVLILTGCELLIPALMPSAGFVKPSGKNRYSLTVYEGVGEDIYLKWDKKMKETCGNKKAVTVERTYVNNPKGASYLKGLFKCN